MKLAGDEKIASREALEKKARPSPLPFLQAEGFELRSNYANPLSDDAVVEILNPDGSVRSTLTQHELAVRTIEREGRRVVGDRIRQTHTFEGERHRFRINLSFIKTPHRGLQYATDATYECCGAPVGWVNATQAAPRRHRQCPNQGLLPEGHRRCTGCRQVLPEDEQHFDFDRRSKRQSFRTRCKACEREADRRRYHAKKAASQEFRRNISSVEHHLDDTGRDRQKEEFPLANIAPEFLSPLVAALLRMEEPRVAAAFVKWEAAVAEYIRAWEGHIQQREEAKVQQRQLVEDRKRAHSGRRSRNPAYAYEYDPEWFEQYRERIRTVR